MVVARTESVAVKTNWSGAFDVGAWVRRDLFLEGHELVVGVLYVGAVLAVAV